jgi:hypothetical protein
VPLSLLFGHGFAIGLAYVGHGAEDAGWCGHVADVSITDNCWATKKLRLGADR